MTAIHCRDCGRWTPPDRCGICWDCYAARCASLPVAEVDALLRRHDEREFFATFVRLLNDVEEPDCDWQNRLGWAWDALGGFAERMGPDFVEIANCEGRLTGWLMSNSCVKFETSCVDCRPMSV